MFFLLGVFVKWESLRDKDRKREKYSKKFLSDRGTVYEDFNIYSEIFVTLVRLVVSSIVNY